jgi:uncharacterized protein
MRKRPQPPKRKSSFFKRLGWGFIGFILLVFTGLIGYFIGFNQSKIDLAAERNQTRHLVDQIKQIVAIDENNKSIPIPMEEPIKPQHEYAPKEDRHVSPPPAAIRPKRLEGVSAKLVIIIDDVSYARDINAIHSTGLPLVMSFLPPSSRHPDSAHLAENESHYMIHLPLEAMDYNAEESSTLRVDDSEETITKRIDTLKQLFPKARYVNNHTGSKFTADTPAMEKLIRVLEKEKMHFVDSRTTAQTKAPEVTRLLGIRYISRDVFLDHKDGVENIKKQIQEAVDKAKRHGTAIAIGHPRHDTIQAIIESKELLGEVELVGIDQI